MTQEQVEDLVRTILLEKKGWAARLPLIREEMGRLGITQFDLTIWLREQGVRTARGPVSNDTVGRWLRGAAPDTDAQDAIVDMLVEASLGKWSKARYLSWRQGWDAIRPIWPPRMRRMIGPVLAAAVLLVLVPMPAGAQTTLAWGPGGTEMGASSPVYSQPIRVIDAMAGTLSLERRRIWVKARNQALTNWQLPFTVERIPESALAYIWTDENINAGLAITDIEPNAILLVRNHSIYNQNVGGWVESEQGGVAAYAPWAPWWKTYYFNQLVGVIGHEVGHCLGFGHGSPGIMGGATKPSAVELTTLHAYWG